MSNRCGEYYGRYDESGQCPGPFAKFLESRGICAQYTMPGTPQQNGVAERKNNTIMAVVKTMIHDQDLPMCLWAEGAMTIVYVQNRLSHSALGSRPLKRCSPERSQR